MIRPGFIKMLRKSALAALMGTGILLSGCTSLILGDGEIPPRYTLEPLPGASVSGSETLPVRLVVTDPQAEAAFDTSRISFSPEELRYEYYADGEWTDQLPHLWGIFLQRSFENDGRIATVGDRRAVPLGDYVLRTDIRAFHIEERGGQRTARVSYSAKLFNARNEGIASRVFTVTEPVSGASLVASVEALNRAARNAGNQSVDWVIGNVVENRAETERATAG